MEYRYPRVPGTTVLTTSLPPLPANAQLPQALTSPPPPTMGAKQIFAFWHSGIHNMFPYLIREVLAWYRRYSPLGWNIYVLDAVPGSALNVSNYVDTSDPLLFPDAFTKNKIDSLSPYHHTSDLVRFPLLLKYGGVYLDVTLLQIGDLDWLWTQHISNPSSPFDFSGFIMSAPTDLQIVNFAMACTPQNPLVSRTLQILLKLWEGKTNTTGMHAHPLVNHTPIMRVPPNVALPKDVRAQFSPHDTSMTDYAIQIQCFGAAQHWVDGDDWDGPQYTREKCWLYSMVDHAYIPEQMTMWSGQRIFELLSKRVVEPESPEETVDHKLAREIVEKTIANSWVWKLGNSEVFGGPTLGLLWRRNEGSDCVEGTYAGWLRWAELNLKQTTPPEPIELAEFDATMTGKIDEQVRRNDGTDVHITVRAWGQD